MSLFAAVLFLVNVIYCAEAHFDAKFRADFDRVIQPVCPSLKNCSIPYTLSLIQDYDGHHFDSVWIQHGQIQTKDGQHYQESTVLRMPEINLLPTDRLYAGLRLYQVPDDVQSMYLVDVTQTAQNGRTASAFVNADGVALHARVKPMVVQQKGGNNKACQCVQYKCSCCEHMSIPKLDVNETGCANVTLLTKDKGISITLSINDWVLYNETFSVHNPPPVCVDVPGLKKFASICIRLLDVHMSTGHMTGCVELEAELYHVKIYKQEMGCFDIPY